MTAIARFFAHIRRLWPDYRVLAPAPFVLWPLWCLAIGERRWELVVIVFLVPFLAYFSEATKRLFIGLYPVGLLGLVYDAMRFVKYLGVTADRVHLCDLRALEMRYFGVDTNGVAGTVHDWFQAHSSTALDLYCAIPYGTFIFVAIGFATYLYFRDYGAMCRFGWTFLVVNIAGFITYHLYPAAPPWYFHAHGCTVDLLSHASEGPNLARVDAILGVHYFAGFYGRSNDVFGAVPSLHVAYPCLIALYGWPLASNTIKGWAGRALMILFLGSMCFSAVYLDHHWIVDVLLGLFYTVVTYAGVNAVMRRSERAQAPVLRTVGS